MACSVHYSVVSTGIHSVPSSQVMKCYNISSLLTGPVLTQAYLVAAGATCFTTVLKFSMGISKVAKSHICPSIHLHRTKLALDTFS
jgi:hypothetical protein